MRIIKQLLIDKAARVRRVVGVTVLSMNLLVMTTHTEASPSKAPHTYVEDLHFDTLPTQGSVRAIINSHSQSFDFHTGPSHLIAYQLPASDMPLVIDVQSFLGSNGRNLQSRVFYPIVAVLDKDFLVKRTTSLQDLRFDTPYLERTTEPAYRVSLRIDPNSDERYLVIFTPRGLVEQAQHLQELASAEDTVVGFGATDVGELQISVKPLSH